MAQAGLTAVEVKLKHNDFLSIAHISDLHFKLQTAVDESHLAALRRAVKDENVDMLVVTGDIADNPIGDILASLWDQPNRLETIMSLFAPKEAIFNNWQNNLTTTFQTARSFLEGVCSDGNISNDCFFVVPGNHDMKIQGLVSIKGFIKKFWLPELNPTTDLTKAAFDGVFHNSMRDRLVKGVNSAGKAIMEIVVVCLDSNGLDPFLNFATGRVEAGELNRLGGYVTDIAFKQAYKIVLLHHHPMPMPGTENISKKSDVLFKDQFLLLKNAGAVMREFTRANVNLVLHGHKHSPGFAYVTYPAGSETKHSVTVVGAGSAGVNGDKGYRFHILKIYRDGRLHLQDMIRDAAEGSYYPGPHYWLIDYSQGRTARLSRSIYSLQEQLCTRVDKVIYHVKIDSNSDAVETLSFERLRAIRDDKKLDSVPSNIRTTTGYFGKEPSVTYEGHGFYKNIFWRKNTDISLAEDGLLKGSLVFDPPLVHEHPADVSIETLYCNSFEFVKEYRQKITSDRDSSENINFKAANDLMNHLTMVVEFPPFFSPANKNVRLRAKSHDGEMDSEEFTHLSASLLERTIGDRSITMASIPSPLPGFTYYLEWNLPSEAEYEERRFSKISEEENGLFEAYTNLLLKGDVIKAKLRNLLNEARDALNRDLKNVIEEEFKEPKPQDLIQSNDELCFFVLDKTTLVLRIAGGTFSDADPVWNSSLKWGDGVAGQVYRRHASVAFASSGKGTRYYVRLQGAIRDHESLFCIPICYPLRPDLQMSERKILGVLSIGAYTKSAELMRLTKPDNKSLSLGAVVLDLVNGHLFAEPLVDALEKLRTGRY